jgi:adhesin/invasin
MSVISSITATNISTTGTTINYTLGSSVTSDIYLYKFISRIDVPTPLTAIGDTVVLVQTVVSGTPSGNYSITDTNLSSNTAYAYAFYNGNGSGTAIPYNPFVKLKTYVDVNYVNANALTATSTEISNTLSNTLSSQTTCYLYRYSSITSIPTAPTILDTSIGSYLTSFNIAQGTNVSPTTTLVSYTDTTLSNTSYTYAYYNGQSNGTSTILSNTSVVAQSDSTITFATVDTSSISISIITNTLARLNYTIRNNLPNQNTDTYLFRFAASSAPISDPTSGVQIGSAITTYGDGGVGISSTPINATGLSANTQYTFAFFNGNTSSATILRNNTRAVQSVTFSTTNVLNTSLTASSITPVSATINYTLSNTPSIIGTTVYLYRFTGNSAPTTLSGGTSRRSVVLTANHSATSSNFFDTGLSINNSYTYAFYDGSSNAINKILTSDGTTSTSVSINTTLTTVTFRAVTNLFNTVATINYTLTNANSTTIPSYLYRFIGANASTVLSAGGTFVGSANSLGTAASTNDTGLTGATKYTYAFYNAQTIGASYKITDTVGAVQSITFNTTNFYNTSITSSNILNTQAKINYALSNSGVNTVSVTGYLYRFVGSSAPTVNPTTGTSVISVLNDFNTTVNNFFDDSGLSVATQYTYAFYNGNTSSAIILTDTSLINKSVTLKTTNIVLNTLTSSNVTTNSAQINYNISNSTTTQSATVYLYRFTSIPSNTLSISGNGGTNIITGGVTVNGSITIDASYNNTGLSKNIFYYAFYNGNTTGTSTILPITTGGNYITVRDFVSVTSLTASSIEITSATINYSITNPLSTQITAYLFRFIGNTVPSTNPTTNGTQILSVDISANSSKNSQIFSDTGLIQNTGYSYAFYTTNNSSGTVLTNLSANPRSVDIFTDMYVQALSISSPNRKNYCILSYLLGNGNNSVSSNTSYLYRYIGATAPSTLDTNNGTFILSSTTTTNSLTYFDTGLQANTQYTYAFYDGSLNGVNTIMYIGLNGTSGPTFPLVAYTVTIYTSNVVITNLTPTLILNTSVVLNYTFTNNPATRTGEVSLYRFTVIPSTIFDLSGTLVVTNSISANSSYANSIVNSSLTPSTTYYYAFYDGINANISSILPITGGGNYITVQTTGVTQSSISASQISPNGATINYSIANAANSSTATLYLYRYSGITTATTRLNTSTGTQVTSMVPAIPITLTASGTTSSSVTISNLSLNTNYTYQFYNGNVNGSSPILSTTVTGGINQYVYFKTTDISLSSSNVLNTSALLSYTLSNTNNTTLTSYLYSFLGSTAPAILNTSSGTSITSIDVSSGSNESPTIKTSTYLTTGLIFSTQYTYAFYNGQTNNTSTILTNISGSNILTTFTTSNLWNTALTINTLTSNSVTIGYTLTNNSVTQTAYLYRFLGSNAPTTLDASGINIITGGVSVSNTPISSTTTNSSLTSNITYTYAFYNGNINGSSTKLTSDGTTPVQLTIFTTTNVIISALNPTGLTSSQVRINYTLFNYQVSNKNSYLYRFVGSSAPSTLNAFGTSITSETTSALSGGNPSKTDTSYNDTGLTVNTQYTYGFYNGNSNGTSVLLMNYSETPLTTTIYTQDLLPPVTYDVYVSTYKNTAITIHLEATDPQTSALSYTYEAPNKGILTGSGPDVLYTPTSTGADSFTYYATNVYDLSSNPSTVYIDINHSNPPCFKEGSRILCFNPQEEKEEYIPIETIRKGTLVKTIKHGYVKVDMIGKSTIYNSGDSERITNRLFVCAQDQYPELFEELVLTGYHAILVDRFKDVEERARTRELLKYNYMTDGKYRLPACIDARAKPYEIEGEFTIWHVALENEDYFMNYGIYANGLIVESCSKRYLKELSKMTLIE